MNKAASPTSSRQPVPRRVVWILLLEVVALAMLGTVALDLYAHKKLERIGGVNAWGYRGPIAHAKSLREVRVALVGGTRAFGWGMVASATLAPALYTRMMLVIDRPGTDPPPLVVVNLGRPGDSVSDYPSTIAHYAGLRPDYICLYDDLGAADIRPPWGRSGVFALTGYLPMLPLALREKGLALRYGSVMKGYAADPGPSGESWLKRTFGLLLLTAGDTLSWLDRAGWRMAGGREPPAPSPLEPYAARLQAAIEAAHLAARGVVVVVGPVEFDEQRRNLEMLGDARRRCTGSPWCRFVDLGGIPELTDPTLRLDSWNYGGEATWAVAQAVTPALLDLIGYH